MIARPASRPHVPPAHHIAGTGVIDERHHAEPFATAPPRSAEAAFPGRGVVASFVVRPAARRCGVNLFEHAGGRSGERLMDRRQHDGGAERQRTGDLQAEPLGASADGDRQRCPARRRGDLEADRAVAMCQSNPCGGRAHQGREDRREHGTHQDQPGEVGAGGGIGSKQKGTGARTPQSVSREVHRARGLQAGSGRATRLTMRLRRGAVGRRPG